MDRLKCTLTTCPPGSTTTRDCECQFPHKTTKGLLKALAETQALDGEVWTSNAYKVALDQGVDNASQYVGQLVSDEYGSEVEKLRDRFYRFHDSLFAAYVRVRPRLVKKQV